MHFINKLIKRGIFGLLLVFSFFVFGNSVDVFAANCSIKLNDGNDYLIVNKGLNWTDSGVTVVCDDAVNKNVTVQINASTPVATTNSGVGVANSLNEGFYRIKYYMTGNESVMVTRQIRVLPNSLNERVNFWLGDSEYVSTTENDAFNKVISVGVGDVGYIAVGNFNKSGYIVAYNLRGQYLWHSSFGAGLYSDSIDVTSIKINDIVSADENDKLSYYIVGEYETSSLKRAFIKLITINTDGSGISNFENSFYSIGDITSASKIIVAGNYVAVVGYEENLFGARKGVIGRFQVSEGNFVSPLFNKKNVESEFSSLITVVENSMLKIVVVGSTEHTDSRYVGAKGGDILKCDIEYLNCEEQTPYYYLNNNKATTTITGFSDVVSHGTGYLVVGYSRVDKVVGSATTVNSGVEDSMILSLDLNFNVLDVRLIGSGEKDNLLTVKSVDNLEGQFVAVGYRGSVANYISITLKDGVISLKEKTLSGNNSALNDVIINSFSNEEIQYVFVGSTASSSIEGIRFVNKGSRDSLFALIDNTNYSNFGDVTVNQNAVICNDGVSKSCSVENLSHDYNLKYGTLEIAFSKGYENDVIISSAVVGSYELYHSFRNTQGVVVMIGRKLHVKQSIVVPPLKTEYMGIDRWYKYSRTEASELNDVFDTRVETWGEYYYPVEDHVKKESDVTYYVFSYSTLTFEVDTSGKEETSGNYIKLAEEPKKVDVAFQSYENAVKFSLVQEFARVALVRTNYYDYDNGSIFFSNEMISLRRQNYYFVYYVDMHIDGDKGSECVSKNGKLHGDCRNYGGYAFTKLSTIKTLIENLIVDKKYFVSEENNYFDPYSGVSSPVSEQFKIEETYTAKHMQNYDIGLNDGLTLEVKYYRPVGDSVVGYNGYALESVTPISGQNRVYFTASGDFKEEGKYEIRYCYNYKNDDSDEDQVCSDYAEFVIDRTAPIVNYNLLGGGSGQMKESTKENKVDKQKDTTIVTSMVDIDDYAYTIYNGQKYFLKCNAQVNSSMCLDDFNVAIMRVFEYDYTNPDKVFDLEVHDRAGNSLIVRFMLGTANPIVNVFDDNTMDDSFVLDIDFYNKNPIYDVEIKYIASEESQYPANEMDIDKALTNYLEAIYYHNRQELAKSLNEEGYTPVYITELWNLATCDPLDVQSLDSCSLLTFNRTSAVEGDSDKGYVYLNGLAVPVFEISENGDIMLVRNSTNSGYEFEYLPISKGLYRITIGDSFNNFVEDCGGIGLGKAELYTYVEQDENYEEYVEIDGEKVNIYEAREMDYLKYSGYVKFPVEERENVPVNAFFATEPSTYNYFETLPVSLHSSFDEKMMFTNQFIYVKFAVNEFGGLMISKATGINKVGSYIGGNIKNLNCVIAFYGHKVHLSLTGLPSCENKFSFSNIENNDAKEALAREGIYFVHKGTGGEEGDEKVYYYLAFTKDGTYEISSDINPNFEGVSFEYVSVPAKYSFTIDSVDPNVEFSVVCESGKTCKGDRLSYDNISDFVFEKNSKSLTNIGTHDMKLILNKDVFTYVDSLGQLTTVENRLLVVKIGDESYNAYDYALKNSDPIEGNYILFSKTGTYEIIFYDAGGNEIVYRFIIDKSSPTVGHNGSNYGGYQKYVDLTINIKEDSALTLVSGVSVNDIDGNDYASFLDINSCIGDMRCVLYKLYNDNDAKFSDAYAFYNFEDGVYTLLGDGDVIDPNKMYYFDSKESVLNIEYWKSADDVKNVIGVVKTALGKCYISAGSGAVKEEHCQVNGSTINLSFTISINEKELKSDIQTFTLKLADYFGNSYSTSHSFYFDNLSPYISFNGYVPTTVFGESNYDDYNHLWLNANGGATSATFSCNGGILGKGNIISCNDTPEIEGKLNNVTIHAYEAERIAYDNFEISDNGQFKSVENGKIVDADIQLYKQEFTNFINGSDLERAVNNRTKIYTKGDKYVLMAEYDYIDPAEQYYYDVNGEKVAVSIKDMYTNADSYKGYTNISACSSDYKCLLYRLYVDSGKFNSSEYKFYTLEVDAMTEVFGISNFTNYNNYYYVSEYVLDDGKYLPALTTDNSCVVINKSGSVFECIPVIEGRMKLVDENHNYYTIVSPAYSGATAIQSLSVNNVSQSGIVDETVWQIARENGKEISFGFGIKSNFGRPIIFRSIDGAGNIGSNQIETVVRINDIVPPQAVSVSSLKYVKDEESGKTKDNYILGTAYYKIPKGGMCVADTYYTYNEGVYSLDDCSNWDPNKRHYIAVENSYIKIEDGLKKDFGTYAYYKRVTSESSDWSGMHITDKDIVITFSEPINRVECSYYLHNVATDEVIQRECSYNNTEYEYREDKREFEFVYEDDNLDNYYIVYSIKVYDISGNSSTTVNTLYVDRDTPTISFSSDSEKESFEEVNYVNENPITKYNQNYIDSGFRSALVYKDSINYKISGGGVSSKNPETYEVSYKKFNFNITYNNYIKDGNIFREVPDGEPKDENVTYYILMENTGDYVLRGNSGTCLEGYCYIEDDRNYYPSLLENEEYWYWDANAKNEISNGKIGVYRVEYQAFDNYEHISEKIYKTIYITDRNAPQMKLNGVNSGGTNGEHYSLSISFENEKEAVWDRYNCSQGFLCSLPGQIFAPEGDDVDKETLIVNGSRTLSFNNEGIFKIYFYDSGNYITSNVKKDDGQETVMTLKYNYREYTFRIDQTDPNYSINASLDENDKMYYEVSLQGDEKLYCMIDNRMTVISSFTENSLCHSTLLATKTTVENKMIGSMESVIYTGYNDDNQKIYETTYQKVGSGAKYFFYTYYYLREDNNFVKYELGDSRLNDPENENVYRITQTVVYFRNDGSYAIRAKDGAGNTAARDYDMKIWNDDPDKINKPKPTYSTFVIDNTAPVYNMNQNVPTGINFWYSVPSAVINNSTQRLIQTIGNPVDGYYYNILGSVLNNSFFYAFATKEDAEKYLIGIYSNHINEQTNTSCNSGVGFKYTYFDAKTKSMVEKCFIDDKNIDHKSEAIEAMIANIKQLVYPTFSEELLFGNSNIYQQVCDTSNEYCNDSVYKYVYLRKEYDASGIELDGGLIYPDYCENEYYPNSNNIKTLCIRVRVKIVKAGTQFTYYLGSSNVVDPDTESVRIYTKSKGQSTFSELYTSTGTVTLSAGTYYVFEEKDSNVLYENSNESNRYFSHYNRSYYAIYVDNSQYVSVYYEDDKETGMFELINGEGSKITNHERFDLIIKRGDNESWEDFLERYEILEVRDENNKVVEVYSYLMLKIDSQYYNLNNPAYLVHINDEEYYFRIPIINNNVQGMREKVVDIYFIDRVGNETWVKISHSKTPPSIRVSYSGEGKNQVVRLELSDNTITTLDTETIKIYYSPDINSEDGVGLDKSKYSQNKTHNILDSLTCRSGTTGYTYGCINVGTVAYVNTYAVNITDVEGLIGFFRVEAYDNHGNYNELEFMYNPADMSASYTSQGTYINNEIENGKMGEKRYITRQDLSLEWNNNLNYVVLYKRVGNDFVEVCNSITAGTNNDVLCGNGGNANNYIEVVKGIDGYVKSIIHYEDEGFYKAEIVNRASIVINTTCINEDGVKTDCKEIKTYTNNGCDWSTNAQRCSTAYSILEKEIVIIKSIGNGSDVYNIVEVDKTPPSYDISKDFIVTVPSGVREFVNGGSYVNGNVTVNWYEPGVMLKYSCTYVDGGDSCGTDVSIMYGSANKYTDSYGNEVATKVLGSDIRKSATYTVYFVDFIGNSTVSETVPPITFTINVELPEIEVYEVDENDPDYMKLIENGRKIKNSATLVCYEASVRTDCSTYYVELYKNGVLLLNSKDNYDKMNKIINVSIAHEEEASYQYKVYVKSTNGGKYNDILMASSSFSIDRKSPDITIIGDNKNDYGFYKGSVTVQTGGTGTIYGNCVAREENGNKVYVCDSDPVVEEFQSNTKVSVTGTYMVVARDEIGNVTIGSKIKYFTIDNSSPYVSVHTATEHLGEGYALPENGFTNAESVVVKGSDNNNVFKILYCLKTGESECSWKEINQQEYAFKDEGLYKVKTIDAVGNESMVKSFIIYRQKPTFTVNYAKRGNVVDKEDMYKIFTEDLFITWLNPTSELVAPIVKVTMNGVEYAATTKIDKTGEYVFTFIDLAGNTTIYKLSINKSENVCLDGVCIKPNIQYNIPISEIVSFKAELSYKFKKDDVFIFATPTNAYGGSSECISGIFNYKSLLDKEAFYVISEAEANSINNSPGSNPYRLIKMSEEELELINDLGGYVYIFVVDLDVAKKDLGFEIGENFFTKDPLGWSLIFIAGIGVLYVGIKLVFFKKRVKVLR